MFKIINNNTGDIIGYCSKPNYIRLSSNGCYTTANENNAQGVAYRSTPYNLKDRESMGDLLTIYLIEEDEGLLLDNFRLMMNIIPELEDALCEQDTLNEERFAMIEDALCEIDKEEEL